MPQLLEHPEVVPTGQVADHLAASKLVAVDLLHSERAPGRREHRTGATAVEQDERTRLPGGERDPGDHDVPVGEALDLVEGDVRERRPQPRHGDGQADRASLEGRWRLALGLAILPGQAHGPTGRVEIAGGDRQVLVRDRVGGHRTHAAPGFTVPGPIAGAAPSSGRTMDCPAVARSIMGLLVGLWST